MSIFTLPTVLLTLYRFGRTVPSCTGRTWTHYDKWKSQLCGTELALNNFKQNDHITYFDSAEFKYELRFPIQ